MAPAKSNIASESQCFDRLQLSAERASENKKWRKPSALFDALPLPCHLNV